MPDENAAWRTAISDAREDSILYRGYELDEVMGELDFAATGYLLLTGDLPTEGEATVFNALLTASADHGVSPSQAVTRYVAASGSPVQAGVAAGLLTYGDHHGGASSVVAREFRERLADRNDAEIDDVATELVAEHLDAGDPVPGYHHPMHENGDPRARRLVDLARDEDVAGDAIELATTVETVLHEATGRELLLNVDGAAGAVALDLGFSPTFARAVFLVARTVGLVAHFIEESEREDVWRTVAGDVEYDGPAKREFPR